MHLARFSTSNNNSWTCLVNTVSKPEFCAARELVRIEPEVSPETIRMSNTRVRSASSTRRKSTISLDIVSGMSTFPESRSLTRLGKGSGLGNDSSEILKLSRALQECSQQRRLRQKRWACRWHRPVPSGSPFLRGESPRARRFLQQCFLVAEEECWKRTESDTGVSAEGQTTDQVTPNATPELSQLIDCFFAEPVLLELIFTRQTGAEKELEEALPRAWALATLKACSFCSRHPSRDRAREAVAESWRALSNAAVYEQGVLQTEAYFLWRLFNGGWCQNGGLQLVLRFYLQCRSLLRELRALEDPAEELAIRDANPPTLEHLLDRARALVRSAFDTRLLLQERYHSFAWDAELDGAASHEAIKQLGQHAIARLECNQVFLRNLPLVLLNWLCKVDASGNTSSASGRLVAPWWRSMVDLSYVTHCAMDALIERELADIAREIVEEQQYASQDWRGPVENLPADPVNLLLSDPQVYLEAHRERLEGSRNASSALDLESTNSTASARHRSGERDDFEYRMDESTRRTSSSTPFTSDDSQSKTSARGIPLPQNRRLFTHLPTDTETTATSPRTEGYPSTPAVEREPPSALNPSPVEASWQGSEVGAQLSDSLCRILYVDGQYYVCGGGIPCTMLSHRAQQAPHMAAGRRIEHG
jgi:hypothetical protein